MAGKRDIVKFDPNERVDLPDFRAVQQNARSAVRSSMLGLFFSDAAVASNKRAVITGFSVDEDGPPSSSVVVSSGVAISGESLADASVEFGVIFGNEDPQPSQELDFSPLANGTYGVYVRFATPAGTPGSRVFWNDTTQQEDISTIDTRFVATWQVQAALTSPGDEWFKVADVVWGGVTIVDANITKTRIMAFEGLEPTYAHLWGDGANDRDADRATFGLRSFRDFIHFVRRKFDEIQTLGAPGTQYALPPITLDQLAVEHDPTNGEHSILNVQGDANIGRFGAGADDYSIKVEDSVSGSIFLRAQNGSRVAAWDQAAFQWNTYDISDDVMMVQSRLFHSVTFFDTAGLTIMSMPNTRLFDLRYTDGSTNIFRVDHGATPEVLMRDVAGADVFTVDMSGTPGATLHQGELLITQQQERRLAFGAATLVINPEDVGTAQYSNSTGLSVNNTTEFLNGYWPVYLPEGATITQIEVFYEVTGDTNADLSMSLLRHVNTNFGQTVIGTVAHNNVGTGDKNVSLALSHTVVSSSSHYLLTVNISEIPAAGSGNIHLHGARLTYETNDPYWA